MGIFGDIGNFIGDAIVKTGDTINGWVQKVGDFKNQIGRIGESFLNRTPWLKKMYDNSGVIKDSIEYINDSVNDVIKKADELNTEVVHPIGEGIKQRNIEKIIGGGWNAYRRIKKKPQFDLD